MTDPHEKNDDWADLLQELGVEGAEQPSKAKPAPEPAPKVEPTPVVAEEEFSPLDGGTQNGEPEDGFGFDPGEETSESMDDDSAEGDSEEEGEEGDDEPGGEGSDDSSPDEPGKKKRRRRRRRRKKGTPGTPETGEAVAEGETSEEEGVVEAVVPKVAEEALAVDEITPEATREMIAKWNVPSWSEIVAGLYRPER